METMKLTPAQLDRACGAVLGSAVGDALGAGYEFGSARLGPDGPAMIGGGLGGFEPGEWTDDTTMAWAILDVAARGIDLLSTEGLDGIARHFVDWYLSGPSDIGNQTATVLGKAKREPTAAALTAASAALHARTGMSAGNGSLMRTAPVALPYLDDPALVVEAARRISALTHFDPRAGEACVLWSLAIRHAILNAELDVRTGLALLDDEAQAYWVERITEAETQPPATFRPNGWVVTAFQAAWSAIAQTPVADQDPRRHLEDALARVIGIGHDTDTTAAIAGALLGARWGASAVPARWRRVSHGYPGMSGEDLVELAHRAANGPDFVYGWPNVDHIDYSVYGLSGTLVRHPHDEGVWLGDAGALDRLPEEITAVVSLCLMGRKQVPDDRVHVVYRLIDVPDAERNPNLDFMLRDIADTLGALRAEGHQVLLHCVAAQSRTPTAAIAYSLHLGRPLEQATEAVLAVLPTAAPNAGFRAALTRLGGDA
jgi:ADP-ribosylglycohydrolase